MCLMATTGHLSMFLRSIPTIYGISVGVLSQTLHGTAIFAYIGVVPGVNVGIYAHTWSVCVLSVLVIRCY